MDIYVSTDIESDGPIPGPHSMLSFGSAAFTVKDGLIGTFEANLEQLPGASPDPKTMNEFWDKQPEAWAACRKDPQNPKGAMTRYVAWLNKLPGRVTFVGYPAGFDFTFVYWYIRFFGLDSPFSFSALDIKSYAAAMLKLPYREATKRNMPKRWFPKHKHTHVALDDAIEQGWLYMNMMRENLTNESGAAERS